MPGTTSTALPSFSHDQHHKTDAAKRKGVQGIISWIQKYCTHACNAYWWWWTESSIRRISSMTSLIWWLETDMGCTSAAGATTSVNSLDRGVCLTSRLGVLQALFLRLFYCTAIALPPLIPVGRYMRIIITTRYTQCLLTISLQHSAPRKTKEKFDLETEGSWTHEIRKSSRSYEKERTCATAMFQAWS